MGGRRRTLGADVTARSTWPDAQFWTGRRVLLTGHTGFKGSWLTWWLQKLGAEVMGVSLPEPPTRLPCGTSCPDGVPDERADVAPRGGRRRRPRSRRRSCCTWPPSRWCRSATTSRPDVRHQRLGTVRVLELLGGLDRSTRPWSSRPTRSTTRQPRRTTKVTTRRPGAVLRKQGCRGDRGARVARPPRAVATARAGNVIGGGDWAGTGCCPTWCGPGRRVARDAAPAAGRPAVAARPGAAARLPALRRGARCRATCRPP